MKIQKVHELNILPNNVEYWLEMDFFFFLHFFCTCWSLNKAPAFCWWSSGKKKKKSLALPCFWKNNWLCLTMAVRGHPWFLVPVSSTHIFFHLSSTREPDSPLVSNTHTGVFMQPACFRPLDASRHVSLLPGGFSCTFGWVPLGGRMAISCRLFMRTRRPWDTHHSVSYMSSGLPFSAMTSCSWQVTRHDEVSKYIWNLKTGLIFLCSSKHLDWSV